MKISYRKLFLLLEQRGIKKGEFARKAGLSPNSVTKMVNNEMVKMETIIKVCSCLHVDITDVMELCDDNGKPVQWNTGTH